MKEKCMVGPAVPILFSERPPAFDCVSPCVRLRLALRSIASHSTFGRASSRVRHQSLGLGKINVLLASAVRINPSFRCS